MTDHLKIKDGDLEQVRDKLPSEYRLARKSNGELVLQGKFKYSTTDTKTKSNTHGEDWFDIPTVLAE